jgi:hypothetical protein
MKLDNEYYFEMTVELGNSKGKTQKYGPTLINTSCVNPLEVGMAFDKFIVIGVKKITTTTANVSDDDEPTEELDNSMGGNSTSNQPENKPQIQPAVVYYSYGSGQTVTFAFDVPISAVGDNLSKLVEIAGQSIEFVVPDSIKTLPSSVVPVQIEVKSTSGDAQLKVEEETPDGTKIKEPIAVQGTTITVEDENKISFEFALSEGDSAKLSYLLLLPDASGLYPLLTTIYYLQSSVYIWYSTTTLSVRIDKATNELIDNLITDLNNLTLPKKEREHMDKVMKYLANIRNRSILVRSDLNKNIQDTFKAIEELKKIKSIDIEDYHTRIDETLRIWQSRWYWWTSTSMGKR